MMTNSAPYLRRSFGRFSPVLLKKALQNALFCAAGMGALTGCSAIKTTADVAGTAVVTSVKVASAVAGTTVDVAKGAVTTGVVVGSAAVATASAAKSLSLATASVAISGASLVGSAVMWGIQLRRSDDFLHAPVTSAGGGRFISAEGRVIETEKCTEIAPQLPAVLVYAKDGDVQVRVNGSACRVVRVAS